MQVISLIEGKELDHIKKRLEAIEQNQLALIKLVQQLTPVVNQSAIPGFISIQDACQKYKTSHVNINNKIKQFKLMKGREIDRLQSGTFKLINESELQEALRLKRALTVAFRKAS
jgi:hypothetical protein